MGYGSSPLTNVRPRQTARQRSLKDAKRQLLDGEVYKLNRFVKQLRSSKRWLAQREKKIFDFETLLGADVSSLESRPEEDSSAAVTPGKQTSSPESSSSSISTAKLRSLEAMQQVSVRLDGHAASLSRLSTPNRLFALAACYDRELTSVSPLPPPSTKT